MDIPTYLDQEFLRPLKEAWLHKIRAAEKSLARQQWVEVSDECLMFYNRSCHAMWDQSFTRRVWRGVKAPKFRFTINKAFELVAVFGPNLLWSLPHRQVEPKQNFQLPDHILQSSPIAQQLTQQFAQQQQSHDAEDDIIAHLLQTTLNYFPREQPGGGLAEHSKRAVTDALLMGRGATISRPYKFPASNRQLVGSFHVDPRNLFVDPDFKSFREARWLAIRHIEPYWEVERRFQLEPDSLRGRASIESSWASSEMATTNDRGFLDRQVGMTGDTIVWYEIFSKAGCGARRSSMVSPMKEHLESTVGQYAYIAISPNVPYPLNCPTKNMKRGDSNDQIKQHFAWPTPLWRDDRWPVEVCDFYDDPDGPYPIPPMSPGLGELKFLNFMLPWLANRIHSSSRDFWAVASPHVAHYKKQLEEAEDQGFLATPNMVEDVRKAIMVLQQPETRLDAWRIVDKVSEMFDKRVGLTEFAYGKNEDGTQDRSAETTMARARAVGVRPEHMQNMVVDWQSNVAGVEAFLARQFVSGKDLSPLLGPLGSSLWDRFVKSKDVERSTRQMSFTVAASSLRRPNRDRAAQNFSAMLNTFAGILQTYAQDTGDYEPVNSLIRTFGQLNDFEVEEFNMQPPEKDDQEQQMQEQQMQLEMQKMQVELQKIVMEMEAKKIEAQSKQEQSQLQMVGQAANMQMDQARFQQDFDQDGAKHLLSMMQDHQKHRQAMRHTNQKAKQQRQLASQQAKQQQKLRASKPKTAA